MRKVCIFCEKWASGGIESFLTNILLRCDLTDLSIDIVASELLPSVFTDKLEAIGVRFIQLSGSQKRFVRNWSMFRDLVRGKQYDIVHLSIFHGMSLHYAKIAKKTGIPVRIAHSHNTDLRRSMLRCFKLIIHRIFSKYDTKYATNLWACSHDAAAFMFDDAVSKKKGIKIIPNGIDTERFRFNAEIRESKRKALGLSDSFVIGNVGRLCYQKNQSFLIDMMSSSEHANSVLLLVGEGEDLGKLRQLAAESGVSDRVIFYGQSDKVEELLWVMDAFVFPSIFEGFPVTLVEAQASGLYCIVSDTISKECMLTDLLVFLPLNDTARWLMALESKPGTKIREDYSDDVKKDGFDSNDIVRTIEQYYHSIQ